MSGAYMLNKQWGSAQHRQLSSSSHRQPKDQITLKLAKCPLSSRRPPSCSQSGDLSTLLHMWACESSLLTLWHGAWIPWFQGLPGVMSPWPKLTLLWFRAKNHDTQAQNHHYETRYFVHWKTSIDFEGSVFSQSTCLSVHSRISTCGTNTLKSNTLTAHLRPWNLSKESPELWALFYFGTHIQLLLMMFTGFVWTKIRLKTRRKNWASDMIFRTLPMWNFIEDN